VYYTHVIEVVLGMSLVALLVDKIVSRYFVFPFQRLTVLMDLKRFAPRDCVFFVYPKSFDAFMDRVTLDKRPGFQVGEHSEVLSNRRKIDFFFERDQIVAEVSFMVKGLRNERLTFTR